MNRSTWFAMVPILALGVVECPWVVTASGSKADLKPRYTFAPSERKSITPTQTWQLLRTRNRHIKKLPGQPTSKNTVPAIGLRSVDPLYDPPRDTKLLSLP